MSSRYESPYIRSSLARALYSKHMEMESNKNSKHEEWYTIRTDLIPKELQELFIHSHQDEETEEFLTNCYEKSNSLFTQLYHSIAKSLLSIFFTSTTANGILNRGSMFVMSQEQFKTLLGIPADYRTHTLIDLGAGDGMVTERMAPFFNKVFATEASPGMRYRLQQKSYTVLDIDKWDEVSTIPDNDIESLDGVPQYDVIACLNLLDRCERPITLLNKIKATLKPNSGRLILALVLPLSQYVEFGDTTKPKERINLTGSKYPETHFTSFIDEIMTPMGFQLLNWTRLPYLCEGDIGKAYFQLNDYVMTFKVNQSA